MPLDTSTTEQRTIKVRGFAHDILVPNPFDPDKDMVNRRFALRGQKVDLFPHDIERGEKLGAFLDKGEDIDDVGTGEPEFIFDAEASTDTELLNWIKNDSPTVQEVIDASDNDPEVAQRLLAAENSATGNDPRKGVVAGLEAVIANGSE